MLLLLLRNLSSTQMVIIKVMRNVLVTVSDVSSSTIVRNWCVSRSVSNMDGFFVLIWHLLRQKFTLRLAMSDFLLLAIGKSLFLQ